MRTVYLLSKMLRPCMSVFLVAVFMLIAAVASYAQEDLYGKALDAYTRKDYKTAVKYLNEYVAVKPDADAYYLLGYGNYMLNRAGHKKRLRASGKFREAADYFREAYLINPNFTPKTIDFRK